MAGRQLSEVYRIARQLEQMRQRIRPDQPKKLVGHDRDRVDDRSHIHEANGRHAVHERDVFEVHRKRRQGQRHPECEHRNDEQGDRQKPDRLGDGRSDGDHDGEERDIGEDEVDQAGDRGRNRKDRFRNPDLLHQPAVPLQARHRRRRRLGEEAENQVGREKVDRIELDALESKDLREYDRQDDHQQQRVEHGPEKTDDRSLVPHCEITSHQVCQQVAVPNQIPDLACCRHPVPGGALRRPEGQPDAPIGGTAPTNRRNSDRARSGHGCRPAAGVAGFEAVREQEARRDPLIGAEVVRPVLVRVRRIVVAAGLVVDVEARRDVQRVADIDRRRPALK